MLRFSSFAIWSLLCPMIGGTAHEETIILLFIILLLEVSILLWLIVILILLAFALAI
jgi:hypothetical protein